MKKLTPDQLSRKIARLNWREVMRGAKPGFTKRGYKYETIIKFC